MTDTLIPARDEAAAEVDRLTLRTQPFIDGEFRDAIGGRTLRDGEPGDGPAASPRSRRAAPATSTPRSRPRGRPSTTVAGRG